MTGSRGEADLQQVTITPAGDPDMTIERQQTGVSAVRFHRASASDLPTMHHVLDALADLPVVEARGGSLTHSCGSKWSRDQRILV